MSVSLSSYTKAQSSIFVSLLPSLTDVRLSLWNAPKPIVSAFVRSAVVISGQSLKALSPMVVASFAMSALGRLLQPSNALSPMVVIFDFAVTLLSAVQPSNVLIGMLVIEAGRVIFCRLVHFQKLLFSTSVTPSGRVMSVRELALAKVAGLDIVFKVLGSTIVVSDLQYPIIVLDAISSTPSPKVIFLILPLP